MCSGSCLLDMIFAARRMGGLAARMLGAWTASDSAPGRVIAGRDARLPWRNQHNLENSAPHLSAPPPTGELARACSRFHTTCSANLIVINCAMHMNVKFR